ncbi:unnamed protein product [Phytophthora fragariaefolia]|uniref:Unnamed protein product n=1 Tax=Phytophthora fragariaefolia TaxID=1490495 RepID=A0A9W6U639_9STRA|nr:unnamed protein product [Phytophthora fragariaefolia]
MLVPFLSSRPGQVKPAESFEDTSDVVKLFLPDASYTPFQDELALWQPLRHPDLIKLYGACVAGPNLQLFVCEYVSGGSLIEHAQFTSANGTRIWKCLHEAALGLEYLHERKIIHGNLQCNSILIGSDGLAKLPNRDSNPGRVGESNFGLCSSTKKFEHAPSRQIGSMRWLAPEVLKGKPPSFASDVYSLGTCILEAMAREKPWSSEEDQALVWKMCCKDANQRASLSSVVYELERLAITESCKFSQPEQEPASTVDDKNIGKMEELWLKVALNMERCTNSHYRQSFDELTKIHDNLKRSTNRPALRTSISLLSSTRATATNSDVFRLHIESVLMAMNAPIDEMEERQMRWQQQRNKQIEMFVSGVADTSLLLKNLQSVEERAVFLRALKAEMEDTQTQYTPKQREVVTKTYAVIASTMPSDDRLSLVPEWFIPWYELIVDEWRCLGKGGFGRVYQAKWLDSEVVAKLVGSDTETDIFSLRARSSQSSLSAGLSGASSLMTSTKRGEVMAMFRQEVDIWFRFSHPHIIRLFGACHVGLPFFVCEYATNGTLVGYLKQHPNELWKKLHEAALGVQYLHARGVCLPEAKVKSTNAIVNGAFGVVEKIQKFVARSPTFESDIYSLGMCIVEALHVVENVERVKSGQEPLVHFPWRGLDSFIVKCHATKGELPSKPTICNDNQWELVKQMCAFKPKTQLKISTLVDKLAGLANPQNANAINASISVDEQSAPKAISAAQGLLLQLQYHRDWRYSVLQQYTALWGRFELAHEKTNGDHREECQNAFNLLVAEANVATSKLEEMGEDLISLVDVTMRYYALNCRLDKLYDTYHHLLCPE